MRTGTVRKQPRVDCFTRTLQLGECLLEGQAEELHHHKIRRTRISSIVVGRFDELKAGNSKDNR